MNIKKVALLIFALGSLASVKGQTVVSLESPVDVRSFGMGGAGLSLPGGAYSIFNNAAALAVGDNTWGAGYTFGLWAPEGEMTDNRHSLSGYYKFGRHTVLAGARYYRRTIWDATDEFGMTIGKASSVDMVGDLGYAFALNEYIGVSATVRYINTNEMGINAGTAFAGDLGFYFRRNGLSAALSVANFGTKVNFDSGSKGDLSSWIKAGAGYALTIGHKHQLTGSMQLGYQAVKDGTFDGGIGVEYMYNEMVAARAGYHMDAKSNSLNYATLGLGVNFKGFSLNAAYLLGGFLNNTLMLGLEANF